LNQTVRLKPQHEPASLHRVSASRFPPAWILTSTPPPHAYRQARTRQHLPCPSTALTRLSRDARREDQGQDHPTNNPPAYPYPTPHPGPGLTLTRANDFLAWMNLLCISNLHTKADRLSALKSESL
jgi:hypothetical protein